MIFYSFNVITYDLKTTYNFKVITREMFLLIWACLMVRRSHIRWVVTNSQMSRSHSETISIGWPLYTLCLKVIIYNVKLIDYNFKRIICIVLK